MKGFGGILPLELSDLSMGVYPLSSVELSFPKEPKGESFSGFLSSVCSFFSLEIPVIKSVPLTDTSVVLPHFTRKERKEKAYNNYTVAGNR